MARQRKLSPERKELITSLLGHYNPKDAKDVQEMLKDLLGDTLHGMLEAEMDAIKKEDNVTTSSLPNKFADQKGSFLTSAIHSERDIRNGVTIRLFRYVVFAARLTQKL